MKSIYFIGMATSGKTANALSIALKLQDEGLKVGYFKPLGNRKNIDRKYDDDVILMKEIFALPHAPEVLCPLYMSPLYLTMDKKSDALQQVRQAFAQVSAGCDVMIIDGSTAPYTALSMGIDDFTLAKEFNAGVINIISITNDTSIDEAMFFNNYLSSNKTLILGNIFNNIERTVLDKTKGVYRPILEDKGYKVLGVIPELYEFSAPTVSEFYDVLGGEILTGEEYMGRLVEDIIVGTMTIEGALGYLRRAANKAVITGGDRSDLALTALETSTSVLILTGGLYPDVKVIARAKEKKVPVVLVHYDTYSTVEALHSVYRHINPNDKKIIEMIKGNVLTNIDMEAILRYATADNARGDKAGK